MRCHGLRYCCGAFLYWPVSHCHSLDDTTSALNTGSRGDSLFKHSTRWGHVNRGVRDDFLDTGSGERRKCGWVKGGIASRGRGRGRGGCHFDYSTARS
jgi:hypothetical protein